MQLLIFLISILPGLIICYVAYRYFDSEEKEPWLALTASFLAGIICAALAFYIEEILFENQQQELRWVDALNTSFIKVALPEEGLKALALLAFIAWSKMITEPIDLIVYSVLISMGFACVENVLYGFSFGYQTSLFRSFTAVPAHATFAIMMGYLAALYHFQLASSQKFWVAILYFLAVVLVHGLYDFFIIQNIADYLLLGALVVLGIYIWISIRMIKRIKRLTIQNEA